MYRSEKLTLSRDVVAAVRRRCYGNVGVFYDMHHQLFSICKTTWYRVLSGIQLSQATHDSIIHALVTIGVLSVEGTPDPEARREVLEGLADRLDALCQKGTALNLVSLTHYYEEHRDVVRAMAGLPVPGADDVMP